MIHLSRETEAPAIRLATEQRISVDAAIQRALNKLAHTVPSVSQAGARRRMSAQEMLAVGAEIAALPLLDSRSPHEIMDDINAQ